METEQTPATSAPNHISHPDATDESLNIAENIDPRPAKRLRMEGEINSNQDRDVKKGIALIKAEYLIQQDSRAPHSANGQDDDVAEESTLFTSGAKAREGKAGKDAKKKGKKERGQNKNREYGSSRDAIQLCGTVALNNEFSPAECRFGNKCKFEHDLRRYLREGKREDLTSFRGVCPVWDAKGYCPAGWKCRFHRSHSEEVTAENGKKELVLIEDPERMAKAGLTQANKRDETGVYNVIAAKDRIDIERRRMQTPAADEYTKWLNETWSVEAAKRHNVRKGEADPENNEGTASVEDEKEAMEESRAQYLEPPFRASEKRRLYYGPDTPVLAPLTTQGNLPFRRLCVELGAQVTWSEMAMSLPVIQGEKSEWALMKAHESEVTPPSLRDSNVIPGYDNSRDLKFGAQIAANKPWVAFKSTEILAKYCPRLRAIDLNCGCPIDLVYQTGAGSALLDTPSKLEKILRGMNALSGEIPITAKIRMGTRDNSPNADHIAERLILGGHDSREAGLGPAGIAALTLHGRSRQQRYAKVANWSYIASVATLIKGLKQKQDDAADTMREADARDLPNGGQVYFIGNGDTFSHTDYYDNLNTSGVDSIMIARGALIKPWIFEEIASGQYLDKSASERLSYVEKFCKFGMQTWGSDEMGIGTTRRFLLEWLSFTCRYVPLGLLERLPPKINERPPPFRGRDDLETLLASGDYRDWMKISEMFLGPAHKDFRFTPKHKSNAYEMEAEG